MLPSRLNTDLDRAGYDEKRAAYLELSPKWRSAHHVAAHEKWTADVVRARTDRVAALVLKYLQM